MTHDPLLLQIKSLREPLGSIARDKLDAITAEVVRMQGEIDGLQGKEMSVSSTEHLYGLDNLLPDRPAGRNIIGHAVDTIEKLRADLAAARGLLAEANQWLRDLDVACDLQDSIDAALKAAP